MGNYSKNKGRGNGGGFIKVDYYLFNSDAYRSLSCGARAAHLEIKRRYNGSNNGDIAYSVRCMGKALNCTKDTVGKYISELTDKGFIKINQKGSFNFKKNHATTYILTEEKYQGLATKEFMKWKK